MFVPVSKPWFDQSEIELANDALTKGELSGFFGSYIKQFEDEFADYCGAKYGVAVTNGTVALHLAMIALGIKKGDEVLVSTFTNMATFFAVLYEGATPIAIDSEPDTWNMNPELLESKITPKTKAIIVVHIYGHPVNMGPVMEIAKKHNLYVVEDAAEAHGAEYNGQKVGSIGDIGCFSFYANKIITTGEGGMLTMNNKELADSARMYKSLSFGTTYKFMHRAMGYNYRLTNLQAALGVAQMRKIHDIIKRKREIAAFYLDAFKDLEYLQLPVEKEYAKNVYWMFNIILKGPLKGKRAEFIKKLAEREIESREDFVPFNEQEIFIKDGLVKGKIECPVAYDFSWDGLYIPSGVVITQDQLEYVVESVKAVYTELLNN